MTKNEQIQYLERMIKRYQKFAAQRGGDVAIRTSFVIDGLRAELKTIKEAS